METKLHNRILSALLAFVMLLSSLPVSTVSAEETTDPTGETTEIVETTGETEAATEESTENTEASTETTESSTETTESSTETTEGSTEESTGEDTPDYSSAVGKYAQFVESEYAYFVCDEKNTADVYSFYYDEFEEGTVLHITGWYWDAETTGLWYQVEFHSGGVLEDVAEYWVADPWILQNYTVNGNEEDALRFVTLCGVCGEPDCTVEHVKCEACGEYDCQKTHVYCDLCGKYDCGLTHVSGTVTDSQGNPLGLTVTVTGDALPEGAQVVASVPSVNGEMLSGVYDIKVLKADGTEWQPIDEGKTVTISIPVPDVQDGGFVDVLHYIDHPADINGDEELFSVVDAEEAALNILQPAITAYGNGVNVAVEITENILVSGGAASIETDSFSVYYPDYGTVETDSSGNLTIEFVSIDGESDPSNEKTYYVTQNVAINFIFYLGWDYQRGSFSLEKLIGDAQLGPTVGALNTDRNSWPERVDGYDGRTYWEKTSVDFSGAQVGDLYQINWKTGMGSKNPRWTRVLIVGEYGNDADGIHFNGNGGTWDGATTKQQIIISYQPVSVVEPPTRQGYAFTGWNTAADGSGISYSPTGNFPAEIGDKTVFYAQWEDISYDVTYVFPDTVTNKDLFQTQTKYEDIDLVLNTNIPLIDDNTVFLGWDTDGNGEIDITRESIENQEAEAYTYRDNANLTLVAVWNEPVYSVIYDANGGTSAPAADYLDTSVDDSGKLVLTTEKPVRPGYTFNGWNTAANGSGAAYGSGATMPLSSNVTLYAQWTVINYTIAFHASGGSGTMNPMTNLYYENSYANLTANSFTNGVETFQGWTLSQGSSTIDFTNGQNVKISELVDLAANANPEQTGSTITLYAVWATKTFTITYDGNGGTVTKLTETIVVPGGAESVEVTINNLCGQSQHSFGGWKAEDGKIYHNESEKTEGQTSTIVLTKDVTLTAQWLINVTGYIGTYDNNVINTMGTISYTDSEDVVHTSGNGKIIQAITDNGSTFDMLFTPPEGYEIGMVYEKAQVVYDAGTGEGLSEYTYVGETSISEPFNVVAIVRPKSYTITFDTEGGTEIAPITLNYGAAVTAPGNPTKAGYTFAGWDPALPATMPAENITVKAKWLPQYTLTTSIDNNGTVSYELEDGTSGTLTAPVTADSGSFPNAQVTFEADTGNGYRIKEVQITVNNNTTSISFDSDTYSYTYTISNAGMVSDITIEVITEEDTHIVTFKDHNGDVLNEQTVKHGSAATAPAVTQKYMTDDKIYTFTGWDKSFANVTSDLEVTPVYTSATRYYKVTFKNYDGTVLGTSSVEYGQPATAPATPSRPADKDANDNIICTWAFTGWDKDFSQVTSDELVVTAQYASTTKQYTITWTVDGETYDTQTADHGTAVKTVNAPTKEGYTFSGWDKTVTTITSDVTISGTFAPNTNTPYTVRHWQQNIGNDEYTLEATENLTGITADRVTPPVMSYTGFTSPATQTVTIAGDGKTVVDYYYTRNSYTVTWDVDGATTQESVMYGATIVKPANPTKAGYVFTGWNGYTDSMTMPAENRTFIAQWNANADTAYTVEYYYQNIQNDEYTKTTSEEKTGTTDTRATVSPGAVTGFTLNSTNSVLEGNIAGDGSLILKVYYDRNSYTVKFVNWNGTLLQTSQVKFGAMPGYTGETPTRTGDAQYSYTFTGWSPEIVSVTGEATYTATYTETVNQYTIRFVNEDGIELQSSEVAYGTVPNYTGATPTKAATAQYTYTFAGWTPEVSAVTGDVAYTATYSSTVNTYTVTWKNADGTVLETDQNVPYGTTPAYDGAEPTKAATAQYTYTFTGWTPTVSAVTGDVTYTAVYSSTVNKYTITWVDGDGKTLKTEQLAYNTVPSYSGDTPTKAATAQYTYTFNNAWSPEIKAVTGDATYTAQFDSTVNTYMVTWKNENGDILETDTNVAYGTVPTYDGATPAKAGNAQYSYTFNGWNPAVSAVTGNVSYTATFTQTVNAYTVTVIFDKLQVEATGLEGFTEVDGKWQKQVEYGFKTDITFREKAGYKITEAYNGSTVIGTFDYTAKYEIKEDTTITILSEVISYNITYNLDGGALPSGETNPKTYTVEATPFTLINPIKTEYAFLGWTGTDLTGETLSVEVPAGSTGNRQYTAIWGANLNAMIGSGTITVNGNVHTNKYEADYQLGALVNQQIVFQPLLGYKITGVTVNGQPVAATEFTETEYVYSGGANGLQKNTVISVTTEEVMVQVTITIGTAANPTELIVQAGSDVLVAITPHDCNLLTVETISGSSTTTSSGEAIKDGYIFAASKLQENVSIHVTAETTNVHFVVGSIEQGKVELTYSNGTISSRDTETGGYVTHFDDFKMTLEADSGYTITDISKKTTATTGILEGNVYSGTMTGDTVVIADTEAAYTITYDINGGEGAAPKAQTKIHDVNLTLSNDVPLRTGYTFAGWLGNDGKIYSEGAVYTTNADLILTAQWTINQYTITFDTDGGTAIGAITQDYGTAVTAPLNPVKEGYNFLGWYDKDGNVYVFSTMPAENIIIYAKFELALADLTIQVEGDLSGQYFLFAVEDQNGEEVVRVVLYSGKTSVTVKDLPIGEYTVKPLSDWTWKSEDPAEQKVTVNSDMSVIFTYGTPATDWLGGEAYRDNDFLP